MPDRSRPSKFLPVLLAFLLGMSLAGGTAYAGSGLTSKKVKKIATKVVTKQAPTLTVGKALTADTATSAKTADLATTATTATTAASANKINGYEVVSSVQTMPAASTTLNGVPVPCPAGKKAVGGGAILSTFNAVINQSGPSADGTSWDVDIRRIDGSAIVQVTVRVICIPA